MELRLLTTEHERKIFGERLAEARAKNGQRFKERPRSQLAQIHLAFGSLYGLFENDDDPAERMIAGIAMHDIEMFPQTCSKPDLSHLPARSVMEIGDRWSLSRGGGTLVFCGAAIPVAQQDIRAVLVYLAVDPFDSTASYASMGFDRAGEPIEYPYLETLDGGPIMAQPMILEGNALSKLVRVFPRLMGARASANNRAIKLKSALGLRPSLERPGFASKEELTATTRHASAGGGAAS